MKKKISVTLIISLVLCVSQLNATPQLVHYQYARTKSLIALVHNAAKLFQQKGQAAFPEFADKNSKWNHNDHYIFIIDLNGNCLFHPDPRFINKNLLQLHDLDGKPFIQQMIDLLSNQNTSDGWVHYLWADSKQIFPYWKTTYVMKVIGPDGKTYIIGSGLSNMRPEKAFIKQTVEQAAELLKKEGTKAFATFQDRTSPFIYNHTYIFVLTTKGIMLVDPALPETSKVLTIQNRNFLNFKDATGHMVVRSMINQMQLHNQAWIPYMWPKPGETKPAKKVAYIKKVRVNGQTLIIGSDLFTASPIWMKY